MADRKFKDYLGEALLKTSFEIETFGDFLNHLSKNKDNAYPSLRRKHAKELIDSYSDDLAEDNEFTVDENIDILQILLKDTDLWNLWKQYEDNPDSSDPLKEIMKRLDEEFSSVDMEGKIDGVAENSHHCRLSY